VLRLTEVFRQAAGSQIVVAAHQIRRGLMPETMSTTESDFYFVEREEPEGIAAMLEELVQNRIPRKFLLNPIRDVQVLCPMNRGSLGVRELNQLLQLLLNPARKLGYGASHNGRGGAAGEDAGTAVAGAVPGNVRGGFEQW